VYVVVVHELRARIGGGPLLAVLQDDLHALAPRLQQSGLELSGAQFVAQKAALGPAFAEGVLVLGDLAAEVFDLALKGLVALPLVRP